MLFAAYQTDPQANPLKTPSGRIELFSNTIAAFGYDGCPGHPVWLEPADQGKVCSPAPTSMVAGTPLHRCTRGESVSTVGCALEPEGAESCQSASARHSRLSQSPPGRVAHPSAKVYCLFVPILLLLWLLWMFHL